MDDWCIPKNNNVFVLCRTRPSEGAPIVIKPETCRCFFATCATDREVVLYTTHINMNTKHQNEWRNAN